MAGKRQRLLSDSSFFFFNKLVLFNERRINDASFDLRDLQPAPDKTEEACNRIAAEFLVPEDSLQSFWRAIWREPDRFQAIARRFNVSEIVAARRALDLELISRDEFFTFYEEYRERERTQDRGRGGGDFYATQPLRLGRRFGEAVVWAVREGRLLYSEAYRLTGLYGRTFDSFAESVLRER